MASTLNASTSSGLISSGDTSGVLAFQTNSGTTAVTIDTSQNVAVGNTSPQAKLSVGAGTTAPGYGYTAKMLYVCDTTQPEVLIRETTGSVVTSMYADSSTGNLRTATNHPLVFATNNTERMRIDSSGNVGIGTTTTSNARLTISDSSDGAQSGKMRLGDNGTYYGENLFRYNSSEYRIGVYPSGNMTFYATGSENMRLSSSGNLLVGTTSLNTAQSKLTLKGANAVIWGVGPTSDSANSNFYITNASAVGVYLGNGNTSWTAYSDERLKTDLKPIENAIQKVSTLRSVTGRYKTDDEAKSRSFLIAQDVQSVLPEAVDATNSEMLGVQYTDVIPLLVAAIKELKAINDTQAETINALTARIVALEGR